MEVVAENYGQIIILHVEGELGPTEGALLVRDIQAECLQASCVIAWLKRAAISESLGALLSGFREKQRFAKPKILIVSPTFLGADAPTLPKALELAGLSDAPRIAQILVKRKELELLRLRVADLGAQLRQMLGLPENYQPQDYDAAVTAFRERNESFRLLHAGMLRQLDPWLTGRVRFSADPEAESRLKKAKAAAYDSVSEGG